MKKTKAKKKKANSDYHSIECGPYVIVRNYGKPSDLVNVMVGRACVHAGNDLELALRLAMKIAESLPSSDVMELVRLISKAQTGRSYHDKHTDENYYPINVPCHQWCKLEDLANET